MEYLTDMRGVRLLPGQVIAYGRSCKFNPINIGTIEKIDTLIITVRGRHSEVNGRLPVCHAHRIIVLTDDYLEDIR